MDHVHPFSTATFDSWRVCCRLSSSIDLLISPYNGKKTLFPLSNFLSMDWFGKFYPETMFVFTIEIMEVPVENCPINQSNPSLGFHQRCVMLRVPFTKTILEASSFEAAGWAAVTLGICQWIWGNNQEYDMDSCGFEWIHKHLSGCIWMSMNLWVYHGYPSINS